MTDLVISNATLVDGSGEPQRMSDIAINNGKITEVDQQVQSLRHRVAEQLTPLGF